MLPFNLKSIFVSNAGIFLLDSIRLLMKPSLGLSPETCDDNSVTSFTHLSGRLIYPKSP